MNAMFGQELRNDETTFSRSIFSSEGVHAAEIETIFNSTWLYVAHAAELPDPGSYVVRPMGGDEAIIIRGKDGVIRGFLNSCRHRGMQLCRADAGRSSRLVCPYHAWTFDSEGKLVTTSYDQHYDKAWFDELGLTPVGRIDSYKGLIFASWNDQVCPLDEHLGDLRWYLDILFARTPCGVTPLGPPQRWVVDTNWKIAGLNFLDSQHALRTHAGPLDAVYKAGGPPPQELAKLVDRSPQITFPQGHGIVSALRGDAPPFAGWDEALVPLFEQTLSPAQFAHFRDCPPQVGTIFPNLSWAEPLLTVSTRTPPIHFLLLRLWQPRGANQIEVTSWYFADKEASEEWRHASHLVAAQSFGVGGVFDEDDMEAWAGISRSIRNPISRRVPVHFNAGRGMAPIENFSGPGTAYPSLLIDRAQLGFLTRWRELMGKAEEVA